MRRFAVLLVWLIFSLPACTCSKEELEEILATTQLEGTVSLYEFDGTSSSATGGGGHTFVKSLYATQQTYEEVFAAYRERLTGEGWEQFTEGVWRKNQPNGMHQITVENVLDWVRMPEIDTIPPEIITNGLQEYKTLFIVSAFHFQ